MVISHNLGFPRIGAKRELKWALERYWKGEIDLNQLDQEGKLIREDNWQRQINASQDFLSVGDFSWYDHVLDMSIMLGVIPERFTTDSQEINIDTYFRMARGRAPSGLDTHACEMTKWFDTNYHYIVPEFHENQHFTLYFNKLFSEISEAKKLGKKIKPILLGPLSYLWLGKCKNPQINKLTFLDNLQTVYVEILNKLHDLGIEWVQIDEPILVLDLPESWHKAFQHTYQKFQPINVKILLATYFGDLKNNTKLACQLPIAGLHIDVVRGFNQIPNVLTHLLSNKILSVGIVDGRNIWRNNMRESLNILLPLHQKLGDKLWISSSCSLLHSPVDLQNENTLDTEIKSWLAFATQKLREISALAIGINKGEKAIAFELAMSDSAHDSRKASKKIHFPAVKERLKSVTSDMASRNSPYSIRKNHQKSLKLPLLPTTTIGSFPQTTKIREIRRDFKLNKINPYNYQKFIREEIAEVIKKQTDLGIDVLVHGEAERNDMVEYFGELLQGFTFTTHGWVQSYGSRCVKPPIIFGDVSRSSAMTVEWISYAQSLTHKPVKGMLTGPTTILCWSFVRDDQPRFETAKQIALALRDEVTDLINSGIKVIQIDEPAFREGLPLRQHDWQEYLDQAVYSFRLASCSAPDHVQIHTHMCYSEFNETIEAIAELDADVITIETSRSHMELLSAFEKFKYPNEIGPGVYDIHSPRIPTVPEIVNLIENAIQYIPIQQLWINPDCGLKTRDWKETHVALKNMMTAAQLLREKNSVKKNIEEFV